MTISTCVKGLLLLLGSAAGPWLLPGAQDRDLASRSPEELAEACSRAEAAQDAGQLSRLYAVAGARPLSEPAAFTRLDDLALDGAAVRCYREGAEGDLYLVLFDGVRYRGYARSDGKTLTAKVGGFGPLRSLARVDASDPKAVLKVLEKALPDLRLLEQTGAAIRAAAGTEGEPEALTRSAERLASTVKADPGRVGLLEELGHVYDRLGEVTLGTPREAEYRRLQLITAARLAEALPDAITTHRSLALTWFRLGAYPLAAEACARAKDEPLAQDLVAVLKAWRQADHEKLESFDVDGAFLVDCYRTKAEPPDSGDLFAELTFVVRRPKRPEIAVYTLCSQKLKSNRHYYIYFTLLGQRTLLTTYADRRPQELTVKEKVATLIRRLSDGPRKEK